MLTPLVQRFAPLCRVPRVRAIVRIQEEAKLFMSRPFDGHIETLVIVCEFGHNGWKGSSSSPVRACSGFASLPFRPNRLKTGV